jgi:hypothetical protein
MKVTTRFALPGSEANPSYSFSSYTITNKLLQPLDENTIKELQHMPIKEIIYDALKFYVFSPFCTEEPKGTSYKKTHTDVFASNIPKSFTMQQAKDNFVNIFKYAAPELQKYLWQEVTEFTARHTMFTGEKELAFPMIKHLIEYTLDSIKHSVKGEVREILKQELENQTKDVLLPFLPQVLTSIVGEYYGHYNYHVQKMVEEAFPGLPSFQEALAQPFKEWHYSDVEGLTYKEVDIAGSESASQGDLA